MNDYQTVTANAALENDLRALVRLSIAEDLRSSLDWTTVCLIDADRTGRLQSGTAASGRLCGIGDAGVDRR